MANTTAAQRVFAIPELMTKILTDVDARTLLGAQRINKKCETAFDSSSELQAQAWLRPSNPDTRIKTPGEKAEKVNPILLNRPARTLFMSTNASASADDALWSVEGFTFANDELPGPALITLYKYKPRDAAPPAVGMSALLASRVKRIRIPGGSWEKALVSRTDQEVEFLALVLQEDSKPDQPVREKWVQGHFKKGITLGEIVQWLELWEGGWAGGSDLAAVRKKR